MTISLSEALQQGSLPKGDEDLVIKALKGLGALPADLNDARSYEAGQWTTLAYPEETLLKLRPWLDEVLLCPWCAEELSGPEIVSHPLDQHSDEVELKDQCAWLAEMEDEPEIRPNVLAVYFPYAAERRRVLEAADRLNVTSSAFIAAALRFVLEFGIRPTCEVIQ